MGGISKLSTLEKLGTIAIGYALLCSQADKGYLAIVTSHAMMLLGSFLLLAGNAIEAKLRERFPEIDW